MRESTAEVVEVERRVQARPETVFSYLVDPEKFRQWQGVDAELDARPGGIFRVTMTGRSRVVVSGEYLQVDPPTRIVLTWGWEPRDGLPPGAADVPVGTSTVEITLTADAEATIVRVRHTGLPSAAARSFHSYGWNVTVDRLVIAAQGGDPGPIPFAES